MATWPTTLPQSPLLDGYKCVPQDSVLRSDFDSYTKQRNRYTAVMSDVSESYYLTSAQYQDLKDFFSGVLGNGALEFIKPNPEVIGGTALYRFVKPYEGQREGYGWKIKCTMEKLP